MSFELGEIVINEEAWAAFQRGPQVRAALAEVATAVTAVAQTYTGHFTGNLRESMQWAVSVDERGAVARLGSGTSDGNTLWYAAPHWAGVSDPDGLQPGYYPRWEAHEGVVSSPAKPYTHALDEMHIPYIVSDGGFES